MQTFPTMMRSNGFVRFALLLALVVAVPGCKTVGGWFGKDKEAKTESLPVEQLYASAKGNLRFKGNERLTIDYSVALGIPLLEVCNELGQYSCSFIVHPVALGGVDPYGKGLFEPPPVTGATTPLVVERVALAACVKRVTLDLATPANAVVFKSIPVTAGRLSNPQAPEVRLALTELAQRAWLRDPTEGELALMLQLNTDIEATGVAEPAKVWMQAACFAAFTSAESVFY